MTFDEVKRLSLYEKRLLLGYQPVIVLSGNRDESGEPDQPKRKRGEWPKQKVTNGKPQRI